MIDKLNTVLILISLVLAYLFPIELFILVYAILGPLHYLTEINWIKEQNYFVQTKSYWIVIVLILSFVFSAPYLLNLSVFQNFFSSQEIQAETVRLYKQYINWSIFLSLIIAISLIVFKKSRYRIGIIIIGVLLAVLLNSNPNYNLIFGAFLPTIIHVYVFTLLFMIYGIIKNTSVFGLLNIAFVLLIPIVLWNIDFNPKEYSFDPYFKDIFIQTKFHHLNVFLTSFLKIKNELSFYFYELVDLKIQMFIAFAYTYHYLNWFSKTTVIGWHKKITTKKGVFIGGLWLFLVTIYIYDYQIGFAIALFLSILHVILEFPLNIIVLKTIGEKMFTLKKIKSSK